MMTLTAQSEQFAKPPIRRRPAGHYIREKYGFGSPSMLAKLACTGGGPKFRKYGARIVLYDMTDLDDWVAEKLTDGAASNA